MKRPYERMIACRTIGPVPWISEKHYMLPLIRNGTEINAADAFSIICQFSSSIGVDQRLLDSFHTSLVRGTYDPLMLQAISDDIGRSLGQYGLEKAYKDIDGMFRAFFEVLTRENIVIPNEIPVIPSPTILNYIDRVMYGWTEFHVICEEDFDFVMSMFFIMDLGSIENKNEFLRTTVSQ